MYRSRYRRILWFFARVILGVIWWDMILPKLGLRRLGRTNRLARYRAAATRFRTLAVQMGGVMIKVGQFLSSRLDVLPREVTDELAGLQDEVQPETFAAIRAVIEAELKAPLEQKYAEFDPTPLAAASIGQVHCARLRGEEGHPGPVVVVKAQRPNIPEIVAVDLRALLVVGGWLQRYRPIRKHANVPALLEEFSRSLYEEIDYLHEGKNAETFAANFAGRPDVRVPTVFWTHTTGRVLTLQDVGAVKITDYAAIEAAGVSRAEVATRLFDTYLKQIFEDRFFHADPHPGNLFVLPGEAAEGQNPRPWRLVFIDFGMTGQINDSILGGLREGLIAAATSDAGRLIKAYQLLDVLLPGADLELLQRASSHAFDRFWGKSSPEIMKMAPEEAQQFIEEFGDLLYEMPFQIPENMILLGRCLAILNGICTGLDPQFNVWKAVSPYAEDLVKDEKGGIVETVLKEAADILRISAGLPRKADRLLSRLEEGRLELRLPELKNELSRLEHAQRRTVNAILCVGFLLAAVQLYSLGSLALAGGLAAAAVFCLLLLLLRR